MKRMSAGCFRGQAAELEWEVMQESWSQLSQNVRDWLGRQPHLNVKDRKPRKKSIEVTEEGFQFGLVGRGECGIKKTKNP